MGEPPGRFPLGGLGWSKAGWISGLRRKGIILSVVPTPALVISGISPPRAPRA